MEEPIYENEGSLVQGDNRPLLNIPENRSVLSLSPHGQNPSGDFQFPLGVPVSGSANRELSVQHPMPSSSQLGESSVAGSREYPVQPAVN